MQKGLRLLWSYFIGAAAFGCAYVSQTCGVHSPVGIVFLLGAVVLMFVSVVLFIRFSFSGRSQAPDSSQKKDVT